MEYRERVMVAESLALELRSRGGRVTRCMAEGNIPGASQRKPR